MKSFFGPRSFRLKQDRGSEVAEAAVVLPVLFLLLFSIYWFGRGFNVYGTINHAAREGARTVALGACATCGPPCNTSGSVCDAPAVTAVSNALVAAHLDPTQAVPFVPSPAPTPCPGAVPAGSCATASGGGFTICRNMALDRYTQTQSSLAPPVCGVIVSFQYPYQLAVPFSSLGQQILLKAQVQMQDEQ
jgi:TadE-like protein